MVDVMKYGTKHRKQYSVLLGAGYVSIILLLFSFSTFIDIHDIQALTHGTPYDDVLTSENIKYNNSKTNSNQTKPMSTSGEANSTVSQIATNGEFIYGDYGDDEIQGSDKSDHLSGGPGHDTIYGRKGGDFLEGGPGNDTLLGDEGNDAFSGGLGADYFDCGDGRDSVDDFDPSTGDTALSNCEILENEEAPSH
jgi:Ca2+-binding RTX toxin-like protein